MPAELRPATVDDADAIGTVIVESWRQTYTFLPQSWWETYTAEAKARDWRGLLAEPQEGRVVRVAVLDGRVVGVAAAGPTLPHPGVIDAAARELYVMYVLAAHHGTGIGQSLMDAMGPGRLQLWIAEDNPRARAFYARNGFHPDGAEDVLEDVGDGLHIIRLVRKPS